MLSLTQNNKGFMYVHSLFYALVNTFNILFYIVMLNEFITGNNTSILSSSNYHYFLSTAILTFVKYGLILGTILYIKCISKLRYIVKFILLIIINCINIALLVLVYSIKDKYKFILDNTEYICYLFITALSIGYDVLLSVIILKNREVFLNNVSYLEM